MKNTHYIGLVTVLVGNLAFPSISLAQQQQESPPPPVSTPAPTGGVIMCGTAINCNIINGQNIGPSQVLGTSTTATAGYSSGGSCPLYITDTLKYGAHNNPEQVRRVQEILKDKIGYKIEATGFFDLETDKFVRQFQVSQLSPVLTPWGIRKSTGIVSVTTRKRLNEIYCGKGPEPLTDYETNKIKEINLYLRGY